MATLRPLPFASLLLAGIAAAAPQADLAARVAAIDKTDVPAAEFEALVAELRAAGDDRNIARASAFHCQHLLGSDTAGAVPVAAAGIVAAQAAGDDAALAGLLACRGYVHESDGRLNEAFADYDAAVAAAERAGDRNAAAQARVLRGEVRHQRGEYAAALADLQAAYRAYVESANVPQQTYTLNAIANFYADPRVGQYGQALDYYRQTLAANEAAGKRGNVATAHYNIATTLEQQGLRDDALAEYLVAIAAYDELHDSESAAETRRAMASLLVKTDRAAEALPLADRALAWGVQADDPDFVARTRITRGSALRRLGRYDEARADLEVADAAFRAADNPRYLEHIAGELAELRAAERDWRGAYLERSQQLDLGRRLDAQLDEELTSRLRVQFDSERQEAENRALLRENELRAQALSDAGRIRRLQTLVIALGSVLLAGVILAAWRSARRAQHMRRLALTDELTGLPNRRSALERLRERIASAAPGSAGVLIFDIDHFKSINDSLGHDVGDEVLRAVASESRNALGRDGTVGRIGGEEFLVIVETDSAAVSEVGERLRAAVERLSFTGAACELRVTISLGAAWAWAADEHVESVLKRADTALYAAKRGGRNRLCMADGPPPAAATAASSGRHTTDMQPT